jgi:hypothetical protein
MIIENKLKVLENFVIDYNLPKFEIKKDQNGFLLKSDFEIMEQGVRTNDLISSSITASPTSLLITKRKSFFDTVWLMFINCFNFIFFRPINAIQEARKLSILEFFKELKNSFGDIRIIEGRAKGYELALIKAKEAGQVALYEQLKDGLNSVKMEAHLASIGITQFVEEADIVRFYKISKKGLRLDWVKNFIRDIPDDVVNVKRMADEIGAFDNYVVLHYDPKRKSYSETREEIEARKDPILFGLMNGRRQLYVVGSWVDEVCDLTIDQLAEHIGKESIKKTKNFGVSIDSEDPYR